MPSFALHSDAYASSPRFVPEYVLGGACCNMAPHRVLSMCATLLTGGVGWVGVEWWSTAYVKQADGGGRKAGR